MYLAKKKKGGLEMIWRLSQISSSQGFEDQGLGVWWAEPERQLGPASGQPKTLLCLANGQPKALSVWAEPVRFGQHTGM